MTAIEVLLIILVLALLMLILLPVLTAASHKARRIGCVNNLKLMGVGCRLLTARRAANPNPSTASVVILDRTPTDIAGFFRELSSEYADPHALICPGDRHHTAASSFDRLSRSNLSYFINPEILDPPPTTLLAGDGNLTTNDSPVNPGLLVISTNVQLGWTLARHNGYGNVLLADGSVQQLGGVQASASRWRNKKTDQRLLIP